MIADNPQARATDPGTAHAAAASVANNGRIDRVLQIIQRAGGRGCTLDDLEDAMPDVKVVSFSSIPARLCDKYLIHRSNEERMGRAGRMQLVYKIGMGDAGEIRERTERSRAVAARLEVDDDMVRKFCVAFREFCTQESGHEDDGVIRITMGEKFFSVATRHALEKAINE